MWTPHVTHQHNRAIMEDAVYSERYQKKNKHNLETIKNVQMYLGIIFVSKMENGNEGFHQHYLTVNVDAQPNMKYNYPTLQKPPALMWGEWKSFIFRTYISVMSQIRMY